MASSIGYAHFAAQQAPSSSRRFVPLILTSRSDLFLRPENTEALAGAGVTDDALLTIDDLPSSRLSSLGASFALVDHNVLLPPFRSTPSNLDNEEDDKRVIAILDHHADEQKHLSASPRVLEAVGSCASLVASHFTSLSHSHNLSIPSPLADLLLSAILIDTNLKPWTAGGKATATDLSAVEHLLPFSSFSPTHETALPSGSIVAASASTALDALKARNAVLSQKKVDVGWMSGHDLLRRDYKEYLEGGVRYGLATIPLPLSVWLEKSAEKEGGKWEVVVKDSKRWMDERGLELLGVVTSYDHVKKKTGEKGKHRRELLLLSRSMPSSGVDFEGVYKGVEKAEVLQVEEWKDAEDYGGKVQGEGEEGLRWRVWQQGNVKATRKQVAPVVKQLVGEAAAAAATAQ
jgi:exopolyphosphatase